MKKITINWSKVPCKLEVKVNNNDNAQHRGGQMWTERGILNYDYSAHILEAMQLGLINKKQSFHLLELP